MTYAEQFQELELEEARARALARALLNAERARVVASSVAEVIAKQRWWPSYDELAKAAYEANGASQDPWFGDADKGFDRFKRAMGSRQTQGQLADQHVKIYRERDGAGMPDAERVRAKNAQARQKAARVIEELNLNAEVDSSVFNLEIPRFELRQLTDGTSEQ